MSVGSTELTNERRTTSDLFDEHPGAASCETQFRQFGRVHSFSGRIATVRCHEDNVLLRAQVSEAGDGRVLVARNLNVSVDEKLDRIVSVLLPNKLFKEQSYDIRLRGLPSDGGESTTYSFRVKKQQ